jgi:hypothetical protein
VPVGPADATPATEAAPGAAPDGGWRTSLVVGFWTWLAGMIMYGLVTAVAWLPIRTPEAVAAFGEPPGAGQAYLNWLRWDSVWYVIIAQSGYERDLRSVVFFPLYPMLVRGVDQVLPRGVFEAALLVSVAACYAALVMVHRLASEILGPGPARRAAFYLLAFPTGFYLAAAYNESLFVALTVGSLYFMRRRQWWLAGVLGAFSTATRFAGVLLVAAFAYEYLRQRDFSLRRVRWDVLAAALIPVGVALYALYCWHLMDDPFAFNHQQVHWFRYNYQAPWTTLGDVMRLIDESPQPLGHSTLRNVYNLATVIVVLAVLVISLDPVWGLGPRNAYLAIFSAGIILLPVLRPIHTDYPLSSMLRYALECVPVFLVLAKWGRDHNVDRTYLVAALALQGVMIFTFLHDEFVA